MGERHRPSYLVHLAALAPLLGAALLIGGWAGPDPVGDLLHFSGRGALALLLLSLASTTVRILTGYTGLLSLRRWLGLYAVIYASVHLIIFFWLDYGLDLRLIGLAIRDSPAILLGLGAFVLLLPLALTSTDGWKRRLGRNWQRLHRLVYLAAVLAVLHFATVQKVLQLPALLAGAVLLLLLAVRLGAIVRARSRAQTGDEFKRAHRGTTRPAQPPATSPRLLSPKYTKEKKRTWWAFVCALLILSGLLYIIGLEVWVYWALALIAVMVGWWVRG